MTQNEEMSEDTKDKAQSESQSSSKKDEDVKIEIPVGSYFSSAKKKGKEKVENAFYGEPGSIFWLFHKIVEGIKLVIEMINEKLRMNHYEKLNDDMIDYEDSKD